MKLEGYGEDRLVRELIAKVPARDESLLVGPGDDCAVVRMKGARHDLLLKTDAMVEGIHFTLDTDPRQIGWKALCRAISDVAAMGGKPMHALITLAMPGDKPVEWAQALYAGIQRAARKYGVTVAGGETARSPGPVFISVALTGRVARDGAVLRNGGRAGDVVWVTGRLGGSIKGWHLRFQPRVEEGRWLARQDFVHAMMDLSDGLGADLPRLATASGLGYELEEKNVPCRAGMSIQRALNDGEDYELLLTVPESESERLSRKWSERFPRLALTQVGRLIPMQRSVRQSAGGFQHF